jgi:TRAP-type mannitol/chloroaromatic compound transport system substrate-binding protein
MTAWMYEGNGMKLMREFYAELQHRQLPNGQHRGADGRLVSQGDQERWPIIKGLKMRIGGNLGGQGGCRPVRRGTAEQSPAAKSTTALEKGTIDATEWVGPYDDEKLGFVKVAKHYYYPGWWEGGPQLSLYVNQKAFDALPADYKAAIVTAAASHAHVVMQAKYDAKNPAALKRLVASGAKLHVFDKTILKAAAYDVGDGALRRPVGQEPGLEEGLFSDYAAFRDEQHLWFRFAEAGFDNFMQTGRSGPAKKAAPAAKK